MAIIEEDPDVQNPHPHADLQRAIEVHGPQAVRKFLAVLAESPEIVRGATILIKACRQSGDKKSALTTALDAVVTKGAAAAAGR